MMKSVTRRGAFGIALGAASVLSGRVAVGASKSLNVLAHKVHQNSLTVGPAGDLTKSWRESSNTDVVWMTFDVNPMQDRLFREASLDQSDIGVGFLLNSRATPDASKLLHPLNDFMAKAPVEDMDDIAPGLAAAMRFDGKVIGIPFRHATYGLFYNEALLEERGIKAPPASLEELVDQSKRLTFTSSSGTPVTGMVLDSALTVFPVMFARAYGGDFIAGGLKLLPDPSAMEKALMTLNDMFKAGALPRTYATMSSDDQLTAMLQGRAALTVMPIARYPVLNRPDQSKYPGRIKVMEFPLAESLKGKIQMAAATEFWAMSILANVRDKDLSWNFIRSMSTKAVAVGAARNGNGPVRASTYKDPAFSADQPQSAVEAKALANARVPLPAFAEAARAQTIFLEEVQLAVLGRKSAKDTVASIAQRVKPLLPA